MQEQEIINLVHNLTVKIKLAQRDKTDYASIEKEVKDIVFVPKQKISVMRKWFNQLPDMQLNKKELDIVKKVITQPKSVQYRIIILILIHQKHLNTKSMNAWFDCIKVKLDKKIAGLALFEDNRITNGKFKIHVFEELLKMPDHFGQTLNKLSTSVKKDYNEFMDVCLNKVVEMIEKDDDISAQLLKMWKTTLYLDDFAESKNIVSPVLFEFTGKEHYLPQSARDVFVF